jgi:hypothetical protein
LGICLGGTFWNLHLQRRLHTHRLLLLLLLLLGLQMKAGRQQAEQSTTLQELTDYREARSYS